MASAVFRDQVVTITGASQGIGRELALQLADQGAFLSLAARNAECLEQVSSDCRARCGRAIAIPTDVRYPEQCAALVKRTVEEFGRMDMLVNNAGVSQFVLFEEVKELGLFEELMRVNYLGSVYCTYHSLPYLKQSHGRILAISSVTGKAGVPTRSGYAATKHAMVGFFDSLRIEVAQYGVSVTIAYPDFVATEMRLNALGSNGKPVGMSTVQETKIMPVDVCALLIVRGAERRQREILMSTRSKLGQWVKLIAPGMIDRMASRVIKQGR